MFLKSLPTLQNLPLKSLSDKNVPVVSLLNFVSIRICFGSKCLKPQNIVGLSKIELLFLSHVLINRGNSGVGRQLHLEPMSFHLVVLPTLFKRAAPALMYAFQPAGRRNGKGEGHLPTPL